VIRGSLAELSLLIFALVMILTMRFIRGGFMGVISMLLPRLRKCFKRAVGKPSG
jgi:hypothetical protein